MNADSDVALTALRVDGGMTANGLLMQFLADVLDGAGGPAAGHRDHLPRRGVRGRPGGRLLAGPGDAARQVATRRRVAARDGTADRDRELRQWRKAVDRTLDWVD